MRVRHWLALLAAFSLIVAAYSLTGTDRVGPSTAAAGQAEIDADAELEPFAPTVADDDGADPDGRGSIESSTTPDGAAPDELPASASAGARAPETLRPEEPIAPYTGLPTDDDLFGRPALIVKIDNHPNARPQTGLDRADIVFDLRAEGITRFAALFHSDVPDPIGPVRSSRTSDFDLLRGFDRPLYGSSGGNNFVAAGLRSLPIRAVTALSRTEYFRNRSRPAPHNLYVNGSDLLALARDESDATPWFEYRRPGESLPETAMPVVGPVSVDFTGSPTVEHVWDDERGGWLRAQDGTPHTTVDGEQLAPENVVVLVTDYSTSAADPISPEVRSTGSGPALVLTAGHAITGRWERPEPEDQPVLTDGSGRVIALTPGRTWVQMPELGQTTFAAGQDPADPDWERLD